jgi:hypothetical protein
VINEYKISGINHCSLGLESVFIIS